MWGQYGCLDREAPIGFEGRALVQIWGQTSEAEYQCVKIANNCARANFMYFVQGACIIM